MRVVYLILIASGLMLTASCKKDKIDIPESNDPVFSVKGNFNGQEFNLVAGDNGAYMHTMTKNENGVNIFSGVISNESISFEVGVFDGNLDVQSSAVPSTNIAPIYSSVSLVPLATLSKNAFANASMINYINWFIDGVDRGYNDVAIYEAGVYSVCAEVHFQDASYKTLCNEVIIGFNHNANYELNTVLLGNGFVKTSIENPTDPIISVEWYVNNVLTQTSDTFELYMVNEPQKLTSKIHFQNGTVKTRSMLVNGYVDEKNIEDFSVFELQSEAFTSRDFNIRVNIKQNGEEYRTDLANNSSSTVQITDVKYFGLNNAGKNVYKISGLISCKERRVGTTEDVDLNVSFVFGIEIP